MNEAFLLLGGNLGNRKNNLEKACREISLRCGEIVIASSVYETAAWGVENQPAFFNQVVKLNTGMDAYELLKNLLKIEEDFGRKRERKYGPRIIDLDIIFFNDGIINEPGLKIPHPEMQNRRFVLEPLNEIASGKIHPVFNKDVNQLLDECPDRLEVNKIT